VYLFNRVTAGNDVNSRKYESSARQWTQTCRLVAVDGFLHVAITLHRFTALRKLCTDTVPSWLQDDEEMLSMNRRRVGVGFALPLL
jgi:hypothetical protein